MINQNSRRLFLRNSILATAGFTLFTKVTVANTLVKENNLNTIPKHTADLRSSTLFGKHVTIKGKIFDSSGSVPLANTTVEIWHLSPNSKKYNHRANVLTNKFGEYYFTTDFPEKESGKTSKIHFKITKDTQKYSTELFISDFGANISGKHWEENNQLKEKLFPTKEGKINSSTITFNISI